MLELMVIIIRLILNKYEQHNVTLLLHKSYLINLYSSLLKQMNLKFIINEPLNIKIILLINVYSNLNIKLYHYI